MRKQVVFYLNGLRTVVDPADTLLSLSDYLRLRRRLTGTKIVCSEGDCGACTMLVGRPQGDRLEYLGVDSCIQFMFQLDGTHVVSVEGLQQNEQLTAVQQAMVDCHGSQCGFCTPGFVTSMTAMLESCDHLDESNMRYGLTGNLCRCTGYTSIFESGIAVSRESHQRMEELYPSAPIVADLEQFTGKSIDIKCEVDGKQHRIVVPVNLTEALQVLAEEPGSTIVAGATDLGVRINKTRELPETILDLSKLSELEAMKVTDRSLQLGARASWTDIEVLCQTEVPQFAEIVSVFGSPQIRNVGTLGGNIINASPIADSLPFLHVMEAELELASASGARRVNINNFYRGYKDFDLQPGELLTEVHVPLPMEGEMLRLFKISRRRDLDISSFTAAIRLQLDEETITSASIAYGAVGPTIIRLRATEQFLVGKPFTEDTMLQAGELAVGEITPISDVRGSADYRYQLARNVLLKFYHEQQPSVLVA